MNIDDVLLGFVIGMGISLLFIIAGCVLSILKLLQSYEEE